MPFCSHCGGVPGNMRRDVARLCPEADVREPLSVISGGGEALGEKAARWLEENGINGGNGVWTCGREYGRSGI